MTDEYVVRAKLAFDGSEAKDGFEQTAKSLQKMDDAAGKTSVSLGKLAVGNAVGSLISKAFNAVSASMGGAIKRLDTLHNYGIVMESLGYSAESADASIQKLSGSIDGLPTTLDEIVSSTQQLSASLGDLDKATDLAVGLNDMLNAAGGGADAASRALTQYNQMLAKGKVDMQSWMSIVQTAPAQVAQLAKELLGASANQQDLYNALQDGVLSMEDLNKAIIKLDTEGGENFASFHDQALSATGGIATGLKNLKSAIVKGTANMLDSFQNALQNNGLPSISDALGTIKVKINDLFKGVSNVIGKLTGIVAPFIKTLLNNSEMVKEQLKAVLAGILAFTAITKAVSAVQAFQSAIALIVSNPITLAAVAVAGLVTACVSLNAVTKDIALKGLSDEAKALAESIDTVVETNEGTVSNMHESVDAFNQAKSAGKKYKANIDLISTAERSLADVLTNKKTLQADIAGIDEEIAKAEEAHFNSIGYGSGMIVEQAYAIEALNQKRDEAVAELEKLSQQEADYAEILATAQTNKLALMTDEEKAQAEYTKWFNTELASRVQAQRDAFSEMLANQQITYGDLTKENQATVDALNKTWSGYYDATTNMFEALSSEITLSSSDMLAILENNQTVVNEFGNNMQALRDRVEAMDIPEPAKEGLREMLDSFSEAGPEAAGYVAALIDSTDPEFARMGELWANAGTTATDNYLKSMDAGAAEIASQTSYMWANVEDSMRKTLNNTDWAAITEDCVKGLADGLAASDEAIEKANELGLEVTEASANAMGVHSPSTIFREQGINDVQGLALGLQRDGAAITAVRTLGNHVTAALDWLPDRMYQIGLWGGQGFANGLEAMRGQVMSVAGSIADAASNTISDKLKIGSPSRLLRKFGAWGGEGFALGFEDMKSRVTNAVGTLADLALGLFEPQEYKYTPALAGSIGNGSVNALEYASVLDERPVVVEGDIYMDRNKVGKLTAEPARTEINRMDKFDNMRKGVR